MKQKMSKTSSQSWKPKKQLLTNLLSQILLLKNKTIIPHLFYPLSMVLTQNLKFSIISILGVSNF